MTIKLGLIGDEIEKSCSPLFHKSAAESSGIDLDFKLLIPVEQELAFDDLFEKCRKDGYRGLNITFPYKERIMDRVQISDPAVAEIGAINTVIFEGDKITGWNTDYSGFIEGYRHTFNNNDSGSVTIFGTGGVGKAVAFGLLEFNPTQLNLVDTDLQSAEKLARSLTKHDPNLNCQCFSVGSKLPMTDGLINCSPLGMDHYPGSAVPTEMLQSAKWAFDAVYYPVETEFVVQASKAGLSVMKGSELFFFQALNAYKYFTGLDANPNSMRMTLSKVIPEIVE